MIQPGMMFGGEGPVMTGTWYNPHTGDAFTVRDSFFEDNQYVVTTTDGRYFRYDQLQNYIQSDMKLEDLKKMKVEKAPVKEELPSEVANLINEDSYSGMMLPEDEALINKPHSFGNIASPMNTPVITGQATHEPMNVNNTIIEKALKGASKPDFSINVKWNDYPEKQIEMLKDIMEIPVDEIVEWYLNNIQLEDFIMAFKNAIDDKIRFGNKAEVIEAKVIRLAEPEEIIIEIPKVIDTYNIADNSTLTKEPKKLGGPKTPRVDRKPVNKKK
jgi:hypothetical protein